MFELTPDLVTFLQTRVAQQAIAALLPHARRSDALAALSGLRRQFNQQEAAAIFDQAVLRQQAHAKFAHPEQMLLVEEALQQASSLTVATYRARRFVPFGMVAELGCGIGADTIALASAGCRVLAFERDPVRAEIARHNVAAMGYAQQVAIHTADWTTIPFHADALFADPARRVAGKRVFALEAMEPPLSAILALQPRIHHIAVKVAPGIERETVPDDASVEWIAEGGDVKEALLLFGALRSAAATCATILPAAVSLTSDAPQRSHPPRLPGAWIIEPDGAVIRAGLVRHLAALLGADQLDETIAYLTSDEPPEHSPLARVWPVMRHGPFNLKELNRWLRDDPAGEVIVKKRGSPIEPDSFGKRLKTVAGGPVRTVFLTRCLGKPWMILSGSAR